MAGAPDFMGLRDAPLGQPDKLRDVERLWALTGQPSLFGGITSADLTNGARALPASSAEVNRIDDLAEGADSRPGQLLEPGGRAKSDLGVAGSTRRRRQKALDVSRAAQHGEHAVIASTDRREDAIGLTRA
jgi:hypothetical protein